jgi:hypothetical protein
VKIHLKKGVLQTTVPLAGPNAEFRIGCESAPLKLQIDPDYDVFRRLTVEEIPPLLFRLFGDENQMIVLPPSKLSLFEAYKDVAEIINRPGSAKIIQADEFKRELLSGYSLLFLGSPQQNPALKKALPLMETKQHEVGLKASSISILGHRFEGKSVSYLVVLTNPLDEKRVLAIFAGFSREDICRAGPKIVHYGKYSYLVFKGTRNVLKGEWPVRTNPLCRHLSGKDE